jgi:adenylate cyclase
VGLHVGAVLYGNVGSAERLDFTVLGPAVNETSRIERLCRSLEQPIILSEAFAREVGRERADLVSLGRYALRGVGRAQELFTLDPEVLERAMAATEPATAASVPAHADSGRGAEP